VQLAQHWRDVFPPSSSSKKSSGGILDRLNLPDVAVRHAVKPRITIVQATGYERLDESSGCLVSMISVLDGVDAGDRNQTGIVLLHVLTVTSWSQ